MRSHGTRITIGKFAKIQSGFAFSSSDWSDEGYPVIKINNVRDGKVCIDSCSFVSEPIPEGAERFRLERGDLLITLTGEIGAIGIVDQEFPMYLNQRVGRIQITDPSKATLQFLALLLSGVSLRQEMASHAKGNAQLNISPNSIQDLSVSLPSLEEQGRIVDLVSSVDTYIDTLKKQIGAARGARNAVLRELLSAGADDWSQVVLDEVAELVPGKYIAKSDYVEDGPFFIYGSNSVMGRYSESLIDVPHTIMAAIGAYAGAVRYSAEPSWVNNNAFGLVTSSRIEPKFFFYWLENVLDLKSVVAGTGQPYVQRPMLKAARICLPSLAEQNQIVELVSSMDEVILSTEQAVADAKSLHSGLLSDLLSGEHEIPVSYDSLLGVA